MISNKKKPNNWQTLLANFRALIPQNVTLWFIKGATDFYNYAVPYVVLSDINIWKSIVRCTLNNPLVSNEENDPEMWSHMTLHSPDTTEKTKPGNTNQKYSVQVWSAIFRAENNLVSRGCDPFGQHQEYER